MTPCGGTQKGANVSSGPAQCLCRLAGCGHHTKILRGLCRTYAATVVSEIDRRSSANGAIPPLDILNASVASRRSLPTIPEDLDLPPYGFDSIENALEALSRGGMVVVLDDEDRENEGDLIMAADKVSSCSPYTMPVSARATCQLITASTVGATGPTGTAISVFSEQLATLRLGPDGMLDLQAPLTNLAHRGCAFVLDITQEANATTHLKTCLQAL